MIKSLNSLLVLTLAVSVIGCSGQFPVRLVDGVNFVTQKHHTRDAKAQWVKHWPGLRVDTALAADLNAAMASDDLPTARSLALGFLNRGHELAMTSTQTELDRLSDEGWRDLAVQYFNAEIDPVNEARQQIIDLFTEETSLQHWFLTRRVEEAQTADEIHRLLAQIDKGIEKPVKYQGQLARSAPYAAFVLPQALAAMAIAAIHSNEWHGDLDAPFDAAVRYTPALQAIFDKPQDQPAHWGLLVKYAPTIVQERPDEVGYARVNDRPGQVWVDNDETIHINTDRPAVYAYAREVRINGNPHTQLAYTHWYPEHPQLKDFDPEAGKIEGVTLRITLDAEDKPILFETVYNCGCYHRTYPSEQLEEDCRAKYGEPQPGKKFSIERNVSGKIDMIVPKTVRVPRDPGRPTIRCRAGWHAIANVAFDNHGHENEPTRQRAYTLLPYEELERLVMPDGRVTSMFEDNGLVRGAQRMEAIFFTPLGMLNAGQPRQRGTQLIHWDHYDLDNPRLFEITMRLPDTF